MSTGMQAQPPAPLRQHTLLGDGGTSCSREGGGKEGKGEKAGPERDGQAGTGGNMVIWSIIDAAA